MAYYYHPYDDPSRPARTTGPWAGQYPMPNVHQQPPHIPRGGLPPQSASPSHQELAPRFARHDRSDPMRLLLEFHGGGQMVDPREQQPTNALFRSSYKPARMPIHLLREQRMAGSPGEPALPASVLNESMAALSQTNPTLVATLTGMRGSNAPSPFVPPLPAPWMLDNPPRVGVASFDPTHPLKGGVVEPFPERLHRMLCEVEMACLDDIVSFVNGGTAFEIHDPDRFIEEIVPRYFRQSRLTSFKRQLNLYGFELRSNGTRRICYAHENFLKNQPGLARKIRRNPAKKASVERKKKNTTTKASPGL